MIKRPWAWTMGCTDVQIAHSAGHFSSFPTSFILPPSSPSSFPPFPLLSSPSPFFLPCQQFVKNCLARTARPLTREIHPSSLLTGPHMTGGGKMSIRILFAVTLQGHMCLEMKLAVGVRLTLRGPIPAAQSSFLAAEAGLMISSKPREMKVVETSNNSVLKHKTTPAFLNADHE